MKVPLLELVRQYNGLRGEIDTAVGSVIEKGNFILGENVAKFEEEAAAYCGVKYAVGVANGTDALELSMRALGIGGGDEVITTPFTFIATTEAICLCGAKPVLVDIEPDTFNMDARLIEKAVTPRTKAVIPVHLFGQACDMDAITSVAKKREINIIEDCCQAIGAEFKGKRVGGFGNTGCFSFFPSKNLGCFGDGGMITTDDRALTEKIRMLRVHGESARYRHSIEGRNSRLDELQAAILRVKLRRLDGFNDARRRNASLYDGLLKGLDGIKVPLEAAGRRHVYNIYNIRTKQRDKLREALTMKGIGTAVYYPIPLHLQDVYRGAGWKRGDFPETEKACGEVLALPVFPELTEEEIRYVSGAVRDFTGAVS